MWCCRFCLITETNINHSEANWFSTQLKSSWGSRRLSNPKFAAFHSLPLIVHFTSTSHSTKHCQIFSFCSLRGLPTSFMLPFPKIQRYHGQHWAALWRTAYTHPGCTRKPYPETTPLSIHRKTIARSARGWVPEGSNINNGSNIQDHSRNPVTKWAFRFPSYWPKEWFLEG